MADEAIDQADEAIDGPGVEAWFADNVPGVEPPLAFERISGGRSNLTYGVQRRGRRALGAAAAAAGQAARLGSRHGPRAPDHLRPAEGPTCRCRPWSASARTTP